MTAFRSRVCRMLLTSHWVATLLGIACATESGAQVAGSGLTIRLTSVPAGTPAGATIYVAGTFNNWNPAAPDYRLTSEGQRQYAIALPDSVRGPVEFKFTLGSWDAVELDASGGGVPNRSFTVPSTGTAVYTGVVGKWQDPRSVAPRAHTARATVAVLDTAFPIPQLGRTRRVWLYLPPDYAASSKRYPVLYLQDGQNVFDAATSFAGEWGVDEALDSLQAAGDWGAIVVAVDNGGTNRMNEYQPWPGAMAGYGGGEGMRYVDFVVQNLKPYIDARYRTRPDRVNTGIGGSSLGGLISFYAALTYPEVFGRALVFSPSTFINPQIYSLARAARPLRPPARFYFVSGRDEGGTGPLLRAIPLGQVAVVDSLAAAGFDTAGDVRSLLPADGAHAEWFWRREFPAAYRWLFSGAAGRTPPGAAGR
jgi:metallo-beta-lactamase class B